MTVKNLTGSTVTGVSLLRWVDFDVDNDVVNWHVATADSYFAWKTHGMILRHLSQPSTATHTAGMLMGTVCDPATAFGPMYGDHAGGVVYNLGKLAANASKTVKVAYLRY